MYWSLNVREVGLTGGKREVRDVLQNWRYPIRRYGFITVPDFHPIVGVIRYFTYLFSYRCRSLCLMLTSPHAVWVFMFTFWSISWSFCSSFNNGVQWNVSPVNTWYCYERSTLLYHVVIFILLYFCRLKWNTCLRIVSFIKNTVCEFTSIFCMRGTYVVLTCAVSSYSLGIDLSCDLTCCARCGSETRSLLCHMMRNSNRLDRISQWWIIAIYRVLANFVDQ